MTDADARGDTESTRAVYSDDDRKVAELCRSAGAGLDQPNLNGDTPLICAVQMHSSRCVEVLLKAHASVASRNCGIFTAADRCIGGSHGACRASRPISCPNRRPR